MEEGEFMKVVLVVKMKSGYLLTEREIDSLTTEEVCSGTVVDTDSYNFRDKVGRVSVDILNPPKEEPANV